MDDIDLCYLPGHEVLALFKSRKLSPVELIQAQCQRFESIGSLVNAFTDSYFDEALTSARAAEKRYAGASVTPRPLEGLSLAVKDSHDLAGKRTTHASVAYRNNIANHTHPACERLLNAGAIAIAKTTTPEFCTAGITDSKLFGATGTPWNPDFTAGGSSGGSGAALAAGLTTLATGSDIAGSIRVPAACNGVVGYKPPFGRIPSLPPVNLDPYFQTGPLARTVADCALMTNVMAGQHSHDVASLPQKIDIQTDVQNISGLKIAIAHGLGFAALSSDVERGLDDTSKLLSSLGAQVELVDVDLGKQVNDHGAAYLDHVLGQALELECLAHAESVCDYNLYYAQKASRTTREAFLKSQDVAVELYKTMMPILEEYDVFICPTVATHEVPATARPWETININGKTVDTDFGWVLTLPFNMMGRLPVLAMPGGHGANGLPTGIQIIARPFDDERVFRIGHALDTASPRFDCAARRPSIENR